MLGLLIGLQDPIKWPNQATAEVQLNCACKHTEDLHFLVNSYQNFGEKTMKPFQREADKKVGSVPLNNMYRM